MFNTQHLNNYNLMIMFFRNCENYITLTFRIDFRINEKMIY